MKKEREITKKIPEGAKNLIKERKIKLGNKIHRGDKKRKYEKQRLLMVYGGYDILENMMLIRVYVQKRYKITLDLLEILLFLYPKNYFTFEDFYTMPRQFTHNRIRHLIAKGYISVISKGKNRTEHIYTLSLSSKAIVVKFYKLLSGEDKVPEDGHNKMTLKKAPAIDKMRMDLIKKINRLPVSETKKGLFE